MRRPKAKIIAMVVILSIFLYVSGVLSGLYANRILKAETKENINTLKEKTQKDLDALQSYVLFLDKNLKNMQLEQSFMETLNRGEMCNFSVISFNNLLKELSFYWDKLPYRLEDYEKKNELSEDYQVLKQQYADLSIRTWLIAKNQRERCNLNVVHGLYLYSKNCDICVKQGEQIDLLNRKLKAQGKELFMFPIDSNLNESVIKNIKLFYGINSTPAIIINDKILQGRLFLSDELIKYSK